MRHWASSFFLHWRHLNVCFSPSLGGCALWQTGGLYPGQTPDSSGNVFLWIALAVGSLSLIAAVLFARNVLANDAGTPEMRMISDAIREGAEAFMKRQYSSIAILAVVIAVILYAGYYASRVFTVPSPIR